MFYKIIILFIFSTELLFANIQVFNRNTGMESEIKTLSESKKLYISAKDLAQSLSSKLYENKDRKKLVLYITGRRIKISGHTSFIIIDDQPFQMPQIVKVEPDDLYVPAEDFLHILKSTILPGLNFDLEKEFLINRIILNYHIILLDLYFNIEIITNYFL